MTTRFLKKIFAVGAASLALATGAAHAGTYELTFTGTDVSGSFLAVTNGSNDVTAISGTVTDSEVAAGTFTITGLSAYAGSDNLLSGSSPYVSFGGLSFTTDHGGDFNFANLDGAHDFAFLSSVLDPVGDVQTVGLTPIDISVAAVPEPANLALMMAGALGLFAVSRRRAVR